MPRRAAASRQRDSETDIDEEDFESDEEYFLDELRGAIARARSSATDAYDPLEAPWGRGMERLQIDVSD